MYKSSGVFSNRKSNYDIVGIRKIIIFAQGIRVLSY